MQKVMMQRALPEFIERLRKGYEVVAPVKKGKVTRFSVIRKAEEINLDYLTMVPLKNIFMPEDEILFTYDGEKIKPAELDIKKRVIFGMRKCDLNALAILDKVMFDPLYKARRENTILIGMWCEKPDAYCFCNSMELVDYYDLFFYPHEGKYYISIGSKKGLELVKNLPNTSEEVIKPMQNFKSLPNKDIREDYHNPLWKKDIKKCLSCTACTVYCPTCNCFDIKDILDLKNGKGKRVRRQTSCHLKGFTQVAGGKAFRESRDSKFKHFVYHKVSYYKGKFGRYMCVGCGRCLRACPPKIDWVETINEIKGVKR